MKDKKFDILLESYFAEQQALIEQDGNSQLSDMEINVWRRIKQERRPAVPLFHPLIEDLISPFRVVSFQLSALMVALLIGILASTVLSVSPVREPNIAQLDMSIFTAKSHYLAANLIENTK